MRIATEPVRVASERDWVWFVKAAAILVVSGLVMNETLESAKDFGMLHEEHIASRTTNTSAVDTSAHGKGRNKKKRGRPL